MGKGVEEIRGWEEGVGLGKCRSGQRKEERRKGANQGGKGGRMKAAKYSTCSQTPRPIPPSPPPPTTHFMHVSMYVFEYVQSVHTAELL